MVNSFFVFSKLQFYEFTSLLCTCSQIRSLKCQHTLLIAPGQVIATDDHTLAILRRAIRKEYKLELQYRDAKDSTSLRIIWPLAIGFFDQVRVVIAWCELRQDFRHFRADRIVCVRAIDQPYANRRQALLQQWHRVHGIPAQ